MTDPFESSRRKLARAKHHLADLDQMEKSFIDGNPYATITEPDPKRHHHMVCKLKVIKPLPESFAEVVGDAVNNLRAALDHSCYALAVAGGKLKSKNAYFPFGCDAADFERNLHGRSCRDIPT